MIKIVLQLIVLYWLEQNIKSRLSICRFQRRKEELWKLMDYRAHVPLVELEEFIEQEQGSAVCNFEKRKIAEA